MQARFFWAIKRNIKTLKTLKNLNELKHEMTILAYTVFFISSKGSEVGGHALFPDMLLIVHWHIHQNKARPFPGAFRWMSWLAEVRNLQETQVIRENEKRLVMSFF